MIPWYARIPGLLLISTLILIIDFLISPLISFPLTFLLPVSLTAWWYGRRSAITLTTAMIVIRFTNVLYWRHADPGIVNETVINSIVRLVVLVFIAYLIARLAEQQRQLQHKVKVLEGLLPICAHCKKIRTAEDSWEQVESFFSRQSDVVFSHTICPNCRQAHFGYIKAKAQVR